MITVGIDEVGRGCWAGPLVVGAVVLRHPIQGLKDSKKLSRKRREVLSDLILQNADFGLGWVTPSEIDQLGLTAATALACERAVAELNTDYGQIVIDGSINYLPDNPKAACVVGADATVPEVSAASIIAKVARDNYMAEQALLYPEHGFEKHVGYGTKQHMEALKLIGVTPLHRISYKPIQALAA